MANKKKESYYGVGWDVAHAVVLPVVVAGSLVTHVAKAAVSLPLWALGYTPKKSK